MNLILRNFGPLAGFFAAVGWLCWEQLHPPAAPLDLGSETIVRMAPTLLDPDLPLPCARNPLAPVATSAAGETMAESPAAQPAAAPLEEPPASLPIKFTLRGTYIGGSRKSALIDNQLCFEGDCLPGAAESCRLTQVEQDYVLVRIADQDFRVEYSP